MTGAKEERACGCGCCAAVLAELEAVRHELGQLAGLLIVGSIGTDMAADPEPVREEL